MHKKGCFKQMKPVCGVFGVCFQSKNNEFQKRGVAEVIGPSLGRGRRREKATSRVSRVSGQGAATAAESRIHDILFWS